ncbi:MAG: type IV pilus assembly protein PilM [Candidatus Levybacteria bacterium]|nr:type IV pilus assembly protein PilM [Candidatus Levybacteria bacterium]
MKIRPFGLDIGTTSIKAVWLSAPKEGLILNAALSSPTPPKGMLSESPQDLEEMARVIRRIMEEGKITAPYANVALAENQVYTKVVDMPVLSDKELSSAIYWEAEQHIPVPLSSITLDWKVLEKPKEAQTEEKMQVLLVGAPTVLLAKYQKMLKMAGLTIASMETEILSAIRALVPKESPNSLIAQIGAVNTSLAIIKSGIPVFVYSIPTGGIAISRAIAADFGFTTDQAEEYKKAYGVSKESLGGKIGQTAQPVLMSIVGEIKKALAFYNEKYKSDASVKQILLSGGTAKLPGVDAFFAETTGIETVVANPWTVLSSQNVAKEIVDNAPDYTIAMGLALRDYE